MKTPYLGGVPGGIHLKVAPDFSLQDLDGNHYQLSDFRGQPVLLVFLRHMG